MIMITPKTTLQWLNRTNGADEREVEYATKCLDLKGKIYGAIMGSAYGGSVEHIAKLWKDRGTIYGFDVFEALHPKHLHKDPKSFPATCMDHWYGLPEYGVEKMKHSYQEQVLKDLKLDNAILIKGEVHKDSCKDIPYLNYVFMDMDMRKSMESGYEAVTDKIVKGGYLLLHDTQNISELTIWRDDVVLKDKRFKEIARHDSNLILVLKRV